MLALYKSSDHDTAQSNLIHTNAQEALAALGYQVVYRNIEAGFPDDREMAGYAGIVTWFRQAQMKGALDYPDWLERQVLAGRKVVVLGNFGAFTPDGKYYTPDNYLNEFFVPFGLKYDAQWTNKADLLHVVHAEPSMVGTPDVKKIANYFRFRAVHPEDHAYLVVNRRDLPQGDSAIVVRTPCGGFALEGYLGGLNLPAFLRDCLGYRAHHAGFPTHHALALYKSSEKASAWDNEIRRFCWEPMYRLGWSLDFHDADQGLPEDMSRYHGVITWFRGPAMRDAAGYAAWLTRNMEAGRKVVVLGNYGAFQDIVPVNHETYFRWLDPEDYNQFWEPFGLEFHGNWTNKTDLIQIEKKTPMVEHQIPLGSDAVQEYFDFRQVSSEDRPYLVLDRKDQANSASDVVVGTPRGAFALEGYEFHSAPPDWTIRWRLDLEAFLKDALTYVPRQAMTPIVQPVPDEQLMEPDPHAPDIHFPRYSSVPTNLPEFKRRVLGLYKSSEHDDSDANLIHLRAEKVLNHLGIRVDYYDIDNGCPSDDFMTPYMGVVTWFKTAVMDDPDAYGAWAERQIKAGRRFVVIGTSGARYDRSALATTAAEQRLYQAMGLRLAYQLEQSGDEILQDDPLFTALHRRGKNVISAQVDKSMMGFEVPFAAKDLQDPGRVQAADPRDKVYLTV
ncbi:MAG: hypothetical protein ACYCW6_20050, partial [Candidatus Xenobia bacterium]